MRTTNKNILGGRQLVDAIVKSMREKLGENILILDLQSVPGATDWFIICQGDATVHNRAIFDGITGDLTEQGTNPWHFEGEAEGRWILIDYSDVVVHIMLPEVREYYDIESLWKDARRIAPER